MSFKSWPIRWCIFVYDDHDVLISLERQPYLVYTKKFSFGRDLHFTVNDSSWKNMKRILDVDSGVWAIIRKESRDNVIMGKYNSDTYKNMFCCVCVICKSILQIFLLTLYFTKLFLSILFVPVMTIHNRLGILNHCHYKELWFFN